MGQSLDDQYGNSRRTPGQNMMGQSLDDQYGNSGRQYDNQPSDYGTPSYADQQHTQRDNYTMETQPRMVSAVDDMPGDDFYKRSNDPYSSSGQKSSGAPYDDSDDMYPPAAGNAPSYSYSGAGYPQDGPRPSQPTDNYGGPSTTAYANQAEYVTDPGQAGDFSSYNPKKDKSHYDDWNAHSASGTGPTGPSTGPITHQVSVDDDNTFNSKELMDMFN